VRPPLILPRKLASKVGTSAERGRGLAFTRAGRDSPSPEESGSPAEPLVQTPGSPVSLRLTARGEDGDQDESGDGDQGVEKAAHEDAAKSLQRRGLRCRDGGRLGEPDGIASVTTV
jgi:hypothetical protein